MIVEHDEQPADTAAHTLARILTVGHSAARDLSKRLAKPRQSDDMRVDCRDVRALLAAYGAAMQLLDAATSPAAVPGSAI